MVIGNFKRWVSKPWVWISFVAALAAFPPLILLVDYVGNYRRAALTARGMAYRQTVWNFTGKVSLIKKSGLDLRPARPFTAATESPPSVGSYADYPHASRAKVRWRWVPALSFVGGPYTITVTATAAALPTEDGRWMAVHVE